MRYAEHPPHPALAPFVECFWQASDEDAAASRPPERVLPDGCVEWIFHLGERFRRWAPEGRWQTQPASFVVGEMTRHLVLQSNGRVRTLGVRFRPGGAYPFLAHSLDALTDRAVPTEDLWGREGRWLESAVFEARNEKARRRILERFLLARFSEGVESRPRLDAAVRLLLQRRGRETVARLAENVGWTVRQLEREFRRGVGLGPKALARIVRFQNALLLSGRHPARPWADLAAACGYADQAHLIRDFREFGGATPAEQKAGEGDLSKNFVAPDRLDVLLHPPLPDVAFLQDGLALRP